MARETTAVFSSGLRKGRQGAKASKAGPLADGMRIRKCLQASLDSHNNPSITWSSRYTIGRPSMGAGRRGFVPER